MNDIKEILNSIIIPNEGMCLRKIGDFFWGKNSTGEIVYGIESLNNKLTPISQTTRYLKIVLNSPFIVTLEGESESKNLSLIMLKDEGKKYLELFIRLTSIIHSIPNDQELLSFFLSLKELFSNENKKPVSELQGLYGELYLMVYLKEKYNKNIDIYYQSEDRRKFDYSITSEKKIEVKTTTQPNRIHHFKLEQLNILRYDIVVASLLLQKDDTGFSLFELIELTKSLFQNNLKLNLHIENMIKNTEPDILNSIRYNKKYIENNLKFLKATEIPRIQEKTMDGLFNVEFDSDLSTTKDMAADAFLQWLI